MDRMVSNAKVVEMWANGEDAKSENMRSSNYFLFSYDLVIGLTVAIAEDYPLKVWPKRGGRKIVLDYTASTNNYRSRTTSTHVGLAKPYADAVVNPQYDTIFDVYAGERCWELVDPKELPYRLLEAFNLGVRASVNEINIALLLPNTHSGQLFSA